jgi:hypothetical protein
LSILKKARRKNKNTKQKKKNEKRKTNPQFLSCILFLAHPVSHEVLYTVPMDTHFHMHTYREIISGARERRVGKRGKGEREMEQEGR